MLFESIEYSYAFLASGFLEEESFFEDEEHFFVRDGSCDKVFEDIRSECGEAREIESEVFADDRFSRFRIRTSIEVGEYLCIVFWSVHKKEK